MLIKDSCALLSPLREVSGEVRPRSCSAQQNESFGSVRPSWREGEEREPAAGRRLVLDVLKLLRKPGRVAPGWGSQAFKNRNA